MTERTESTAAKLVFWDALTVDPGLTHLDVHVAARLLRYVNHKTGDAWPSLVTLAAEVHSAKRSVRRAVDHLEARGWFTVERRRGRGQSNRYMPNLEKGTQEHLYKERPTTLKGDSGAPLTATRKGDSGTRKGDPGAPRKGTQEHLETFKPIRNLEGERQSAGPQAGGRTDARQVQALTKKLSESMSASRTSAPYDPRVEAETRLHQRQQQRLDREDFAEWSVWALNNPGEYEQLVQDEMRKAP